VTKPPPELHTARLWLRPLTRADIDALVPLYTDPAVTRYFSAPAPDRAAVSAVVQRRLSRPLRPGMGSWVIDCDGAVAGLAHLWPSRELAGQVPEMGWMLDAAYWGRGFATEAAAVVLDHGRYRLGLPAVWALVHRANQASLAVAARLGMLDVGEGVYHGRPHRVLVATQEATGGLHHVELSAPDPAPLAWLLTELGWLRSGDGWRRGAARVVLTGSPDRSKHIALSVGDAARVDALAAAAVHNGWRLSSHGRQPRHVHLADRHGFEAELVADGDTEHAVSGQVQPVE
jgi:RimJ/RimL family protein N-acetyltransferase